MDSQKWRWGFINRVMELIQSAKTGAGSKVAGHGEGKHYQGKNRTHKLTRAQDKLAKSRQRTAKASRRVNRQRQV